MKGFPARFATYQEYERKLPETRDAGGFLLEMGEKNVIHFLGLQGLRGQEDEDELVSFVSSVQSQTELETAVKNITFTPLFQRMLTFVLKCYQLGHMPLVQGMPQTGKTYTYNIFKNLVYGPKAEYIYLNCRSDTSEQEIFAAIRGAYTANNGEGAFLLVDHLDNLPIGTQAIFRVLGGDRGDLAKEINEWHLGHLQRGSRTFVGFEATYPELVEGKNTIDVALARRVAWLCILPEESQQYGR